MGLETVLLVSAVAMAAGGTAVSVMGQMEQADAQKKAADYNAQVAQNNAAAAQQQAQFEADRIRAKNRKILAAQRGEFAAAGVRLSGSASDVMYDSSVQGELDALAAVYSGKVKSGAEMNQAQLARMQAKNADATLGSVGTVLGGLGSIGSTVASYSKASELNSTINTYLKGKG